MRFVERPIKHLLGMAIALAALCSALVLLPSFAGAQPEGANVDEGSSEAITVSASETTIAATVTSSHAGYTYGQGPLSATVSYNSAFVKGEPTRFTYNVSGNTNTLKYRLFSFQIQTDQGWQSIVDITRMPESSYSGNNYFETTLYSAGRYRLVFQAMDGTEYPVRFQVDFTVAQDDSFKTVEARVAEIADQCNRECAAAGDTSEFARALWLNDWIIDNTTYDTSLAYCSVEGVFGRGEGTCESYHEAYMMLLNKVGIETRRVDDFGDTHVWTGVKLDGAWYNVDTTWNDSEPLSSKSLDVRRLYFALPSDIMKLVHKKWDGMYSVSYPDRAPFDASSCEQNYFIRSGEIAKYTKPYIEDASGTYSVAACLAEGQAEFSLPVVYSYWPDDYKDVIYNLVAYQLERTDWGSSKLSVSYSDNALHFQRTTSIEGAELRGIEDRVCNGAAQVFDDLVVVVEGRTLVAGTDYEVAYQDNIEPGTARVIVTGKGAYAGTLSKTFVITAAPSPTPGGDGTGDSGSSSGSTSGSAVQTPAQAPAQAPAVTGAWKKTAGKWWFAYDASTQATQAKPWPANEWVVVKGKYYHFDGRGYMNTGWYWAGDRWYYFGSDGAMKTSWQKVKKTWYYLDSDGVMQTGKKTIGNATYYLDPSSGAMKIGWNQEASGWHYYASSGAMKTGWQKVKGKWYYLDPSNGAMKTGWLALDGQTYFTRPVSGEMLTGWVRIDGIWYYFNRSGAMQRDKWIGDYYVESNGSMAVDKWIGNYHVNAQGKWDRTQ